MKKILGLDIGTTSIGWAIIEATSDKPPKYNEYFKDELPETKTDTNNQRTGIHKGKDGLPAIGVRIISQGEMGARFDKGGKLNEGKNETPTAERRRIRGGRKLKSRYKLRRDKLCAVLEILGMLPEASYERFQVNGKNRWRPVEDGNGKWYTKRREYDFDEIGKKKKKRKNEFGNITGIGEDLYKLRSDAATYPLKDRKDWGRILLHLNQWRGYSSDRYSNNEEETKGAKSGDIELFTTTVKQIFPPEPFDAKNIMFKVIFENGHQGYEVRLNDKEKSNFEEGQLASYYYEKKEDERDGYKKLKYKPIDKTSWAYRKKEINNNIEDYVNRENGTVGSYFYKYFFDEGYLRLHPTEKISRIRQNVVNREWYEKEFEIIWKVQFEKHKEHFTPELVEKAIDFAFTKDISIKKELQKIKEPELQLKALIKDKILYYQRPWKQVKNKGGCRFEKIPDIKKDKDDKVIPHKDGKDHYKGRIVIPRSHPLHQEYKIWQQINNVRIWFHPKDKEKIELMENSMQCLNLLQKTPTEIKELLYKRLQEKKEQSWRTFVNETFNLDVQIKKEGDKKIPVEIEHYSVNYIKKTKRGKEQDNYLKGNKTKKQIADILSDKDDSWFLKIIKEGKDEHKPDKINKDGLTISSLNYKSNNYIITNLQLLWESIYDITGYQAGNDKINIEMIKKRIRNHFNIDIISDNQCDLLARIKFDDSGMGQLSAKAIRNLLPIMADGKYINQYPLTNKTRKQIENLVTLNQQEQNETNDDLKLYSLKEFITDKNARINLSEKMSEDEFRGLNYWEAAAVVYGNHSKTGITNVNPNEVNERIKSLQTVRPGSMNNPVVEKIVNETIKLVQLIYMTYGFDEVRIELSRELKASREDREAMWDSMQNNNRRNEWAKQMLREMFNAEESQDVDVSFSHNNIDKIKIIEDVVANRKGKEHDEKRKEFKINEPTKADILKYKCWLEQEFKCPYTGQSIPFSDVFAKGNKVEIEHIIPRKRYHDNSYSNKVITWATVNKAKAENGNRTAYEFIVSKRDRETVNELPLISKDQWEEKVKEMFKGRKAKNLLRQSIPEDPIGRELKDTQYINKKLRERIGEAIGMDKIWTTTGQITDMLRNAWHLNDKILKELVRERFENFPVPLGSGSGLLEKNIIFDNTVYNKNTKEDEIQKKFPNFSKRLDHRHHALDAIIVACTTQMHIQSINTLNAKFEVFVSKNDKNEDAELTDKKIKYRTIDDLIMRFNDEGKPIFKEPWMADDFIPQVKDALSKIIIAHKNSNILTSPSKNKQIDKDKYTSISIRQGLHKETLIGKRKLYNGKLTPISEIIERIFAEKQNSNQTFDEIIRNIVFKEKFQKLLISLFEKHSVITLKHELKAKIYEEIDISKADYFEGATTFDLIPIKRGTESISKVNIDKVIDERTKRYLSYRNELIDSIDRELRDVTDDNKKKEIEKKKKLYNNFTYSPIYYNALYDVRMKDDFPGRWQPLFKFNKSMIEHIEYVKYTKGKRIINHLRTEQVKKTVSEYMYEFNSENILIEHPIIIGERRIEIKKATVKNTAGNNQTAKKKNDDEQTEDKKEVLVEIRPKTFVVLEGKFRALITESNDEDKQRKVSFIDFKDALDYQRLEKHFIKAEIKIPNKLIPLNHKFLFTLSKNDLVVIPENKNDSINDWNDTASYSNKLYRVLDFAEAGYIRFIKHTTSDSIQLKDKVDATGLYIELFKMNAQMEKENIEYAKEENRVKEISILHSQWKASMNKEDLKFSKKTIIEKDGEIKADMRELKRHKEEIKTLEKDIKNLQNAILFKSTFDKKGNKKEANPISENTAPIRKEDIQKVIKVYIDKLGKKVVPYWEFPSGCWDKKKAKELGIL
jgi:CRISPR-associated endonuclease Csn1